ncbi:MAG: CvpA family protein [Alphaproteobacteria bacterium]
MEQLNNLDVVFLIIVGISALVGIARGMTKEILSIIGWVLAAAALFYLVPIIEPIAQTYIASKMMANIVAGLAVLILFSIIWVLTVDKISTVIRSSALSSVDRILGFVFGAARGILIVILITLMITTIIPEESKKGTFAESQYFQLAKDNIEPVVSMVPDEWVKSIKEKAAGLGLGADKDADKEKDETKNKDEAANGEDKVNETETVDNNTENTVTDNSTEEAGENSTVDSNLEVLKKTGEELFNDLVQPKTAGEGEEGEMPDSSDLDKLLDGLEDLVVETDDSSAAAESISQKVTEKVIDKVAEKVADKVADKVAAEAGIQ